LPENGVEDMEAREQTPMMMDTECETVDVEFERTFLPSQSSIFGGNKRKVYLNTVTSSSNFLRDNSRLIRFKSDKGNLKVDSEGWLTYSFKEALSNKELIEQLESHISSDLSDTQKQQMMKVLLNFKSLFSSFPSTTDIMEHQIKKFSSHLFKTKETLTN